MLFNVALNLCVLILITQLLMRGFGVIIWLSLRICFLLIIVQMLLGCVLLKYESETNVLFVSFLSSHDPSVLAFTLGKNDYVFFFFFCVNSAFKLGICLPVTSPLFLSSHVPSILAFTLGKNGVCLR